MQYFLAEYGDILLKVSLCVLLTGLIGFDRERNGMTVGIRTHILVGLCAVLLQVTSLGYSEQFNSSNDVFRLGGQMISGIGFLGAGAIIKGSKHVRGLTTAASLFFVACIGISIGTGMYVPAIIIALVGYIFLIDVFRLKYLVMINKSLRLSIALEIEGSYADSAKTISESLNDTDAEIESVEITTMSLEKSKVNMKIKTTDETDINDIIDSLMSVKTITRTEVIKKY